MIFSDKRFHHGGTAHSGTMIQQILTQVLFWLSVIVLTYGIYVCLFKKTPEMLKRELTEIGEEIKGISDAMEEKIGRTTLITKKEDQTPAYLKGLRGARGLDSEYICNQILNLRYREGRIKDKLGIT